MSGTGPGDGRRVGSTEPPLRQTLDGGAIVENPGLPRMGEADAAPRLFAGGLRLMDDVAGQRAAGRPAGGQEERLMAPVPPDPTDAGPAGTPTGPQTPATRAGAAAAGESYLRLRLRVTDGEISVVAVNAVDGPLAPTPALQGGYAYEVLVGARRIGLGAVPDPGVRRSFPPLPGGDRRVRGHYVTEAPGYDFTARVPTAALSPQTLGSVQVVVHELDSSQVLHPRADAVGTLGEEFRGRAREVARLSGIRLDTLDAPVREQLSRALR